MGKLPWCDPQSGSQHRVGENAIQAKAGTILLEVSQSQTLRLSDFSANRFTTKSIYSPMIAVNTPISQNKRANNDKELSLATNFQQSKKDHVKSLDKPIGQY